jgi:hypothetical protein
VLATLAVTACADPQCKELHTLISYGPSMDAEDKAQALLCMLETLHALLGMPPVGTHDVTAVAAA